MSLGQAKTNRFQIGTAELRVGPLANAGKLTQAHSVGLIDEAKVSYSREVAQLMGGFPKKLVDETPISEVTTITATLREYSRKNLGILLGQGVLSAATDLNDDATGVMTGTAALPVIPVVGTPFAVNDTVTGYIVGRPDLVFVARVLAKDVADIDVTPIDATLFTEINAAITAGSTLRIFRAAVVNVGDLSDTEYFSASLVQKDLKTGRPLVFNFWKVSAKGGMDYATNASDYASTELSLEVLEPTAADYGVGGELVHLAAVIPNAPMWELVNSADVIV